jgi:acyl dehydratase
MTTPTPAVDQFAQMRYWFEDLPLHTRFQTSSRTITEADVVAFAALTADFNRAHVDVEFAAKAAFGQRIAHGLLVVSIMSGLNTRTIVNQLLEPSLLGLLDLQCKFLKPTFLGDTVHVDIEVIEAVETSKPGRGILVFKRTAVNQRGEAVVECIAKMLVARRPKEA